MSNMSAQGMSDPFGNRQTLLILFPRLDCRVESNEMPGASDGHVVGFLKGAAHSSITK